MFVVKRGVENFRLVDKSQLSWDDSLPAQELAQNTSYYQILWETTKYHGSLYSGHPTLNIPTAIARLSHQVSYHIRTVSGCGKGPYTPLKKIERPSPI